jgi:hypothetical protein
MMNGRYGWMSEMGLLAEANMWLQFQFSPTPAKFFATLHHFSSLFFNAFLHRASPVLYASEVVFCLSSTEAVHHISSPSLSQNLLV